MSETLTEADIDMLEEQFCEYYLVPELCAAARKGIAQDIIAAKDAEIARLRAALEKHGGHLDCCKHPWSDKGEELCTCGLNAALSQQQE